MSTLLTNPQKRYLRGLAHALKPVLMVGAKGVTPAVLAELEQALEQHELVKVKVAAEDREVRDALVADLARRADAALVQRIGHVAILYRPSKDHRHIVLPRA